MTSVVCECTIIVSSRKMMSVVNMCAVIVQQIATELLFFFNDVLVCVFMHLNCLRSCVDASIPIPETEVMCGCKHSCSRVFLSMSHLASYYRHADFERGDNW